MIERKPSVCPHDCPGACALVVTVEDGRITHVNGDPSHPFTQGVICHKVSRYAERVYSPMRVLYPRRRVGAKGEGKFARISWDEAIGEVADRLRTIIARYGGEAILPFSYGGTMGVVHRYCGWRFFHALGASQFGGTICVATAYAGWQHTLGAVMGSDVEDLPQARHVILWGINAVSTHINLLPFVKKARANGAKVTVIDPYRNRTAQMADEYIPIRPATDTALVLGMMHVLIAEDLLDHAYLARATLGFEALREHVKPCTPAWAAEITGIPAATVVDLARRYGREPRTFIRVGIGVSRHENGGMTLRSIACLPALTGSWQVAGGGALMSTGGTFPLNMAAVERKDLLARPTRTINMIHLGRALLEVSGPPIMALYVHSSNPASIVPHQSKVLAGLRREDLFTVVHEQVFTDTTDYADIVLPATTSMETRDMYRSYGQLYLQYHDPVLPPQGESKSNLEAFHLLARAMGLTDPVQFEDEATIIRKALDTPDPRVAGITAERVMAERSVRLNVARPFLPFKDGAPTPSGKIEFYSDGMARAGLPPLPTYVPLKEGPANPEVARRFPLQLIVPPNYAFLNSSFSQSALLRDKEGRPTILLHPRDAAARGILDGQPVQVWNDRGKCLAYAQVSEDTQRGLGVMPGLWWHKFSPGGLGVNVLTSDRTADMGGGPALHSNMVEVAAA
jgi:anaerobic selenocysteine-containing dehydrogenase